jgi:hypothetical protein
MTRAVSVMIAVLVLLGVGWFFGQRPVSGLKRQLEEQEQAFLTENADLELRANTAEAKGLLWAAHAEILIATQDVAQKNFGTASDRVSRARDLITRAAGIPGITLDLGEVRDITESALTQIGALDPGAPETLKRAASELNRLLQKVGQA